MTVTDGHKKQRAIARALAIHRDQIEEAQHAGHISSDPSSEEIAALKADPPQWLDDYIRLNVGRSKGDLARTRATYSDDFMDRYRSPKAMRRKRQRQREAAEYERKYGARDRDLDEQWTLLKAVGTPQGDPRPWDEHLSSEAQTFLHRRGWTDPTRGH